VISIRAAARRTLSTISTRPATSLNWGPGRRLRPTGPQDHRRQPNGGMARHGGAPSPAKDPSKVDRQRCYAGRYCRQEHRRLPGLAKGGGGPALVFWVKSRCPTPFWCATAELVLDQTPSAPGKESATSEIVQSGPRALRPAPYAITRMLDLLHPMYRPHRSLTAT